MQCPLAIFGLRDGVTGKDSQENKPDKICISVNFQDDGEYAFGVDLSIHVALMTMQLVCWGLIGFARQSLVQRFIFSKNKDRKTCRQLSHDFGSS
jgi:hypothetical protein